MHAGRSGRFREDNLQDAFGLAAPDDHFELRADVSRVLAGVTLFDRDVALCLMGRSAVETSRVLGASRACVYRAIGRLRAAFSNSGFADRECRSCDSSRPNCRGCVRVPHEVRE
jgi:hypothetical protein